jgi:hypothetical protein
MKNWKVYSLSLVFLFFGKELLAQGCSQCRLMAEQASELDQSAFSSNINFGILYLMLIPYFLLMFLFRKQLIGWVQSLRKKNA